LDSLTAVAAIVHAEAERIFEGEKGWLDQKLAKTDEEIQKYTTMKDGILDGYFGDLPQV